MAILSDEQLKAAMGADVYDSLIAKLVPAQPQRTALQEFAVWLQGSVRSKTMWLGALILAWPTMRPDLQPVIEELLGPDWTKKIVYLLGGAVVILRAVTNGSIKEKSPAAVKPPTT